MGSSHTSDDADPGAFAESWLREQQRFWEGFRGDDAAGLARAEQLWKEACERWWEGVAGTVPAPLAAQLRTALEQTRLWITVSGGKDDGNPAAAAMAGTLTPERLFAAAADAVRDAGGGPDPFEDPRYLRAFQTLMDLLTGAIQDALATIRLRLEETPAATPRQVHAIYTREIERRYLAVAGGDDFARAVGELVNAQVAMMPPRRDSEA